MHNGTLVEAGKINMPKGGNAIAYAIVNLGYRIKGYYVNGEAVGRQSPYNIVNMSEDILLEIEYERIPVEGDANSDGTADILDLVLVNKGEREYDKTVFDFVDPENKNIIDNDDILAFRKRLLK